MMMNIALWHIEFPGSSDLNRHSARVSKGFTFESRLSTITYGLNACIDSGPAW